jgi:hypothetical protein
MSGAHEQFSKQFYTWEQRGRGWKVFPEPVSLEPPFRPFNGHYLPLTPAVDDGRRPTFLSSFVEKLSRKLSTAPPEVPAEPAEEEEAEPEPLQRGPLVELQTSLPAKLDISKETFEQFLLNISLCREPIAFELLGLPAHVTAQFAAHPDDAPLVRRQLQAYFPEALFQEREGTLDKAWRSLPSPEDFALEFGLEREFMFPLASGKIDPFIGIIGALSEIQPGEVALFQVLFQPARNRWAESITNSVTGTDGKPFFIDAPELFDAAESKVAQPLFAAVVRIAIKTERHERMLQLARDLAGSLTVFTHPKGNALIPLSNDDYASFEDHIEDVLLRQSRRSGMLLNSDELIGFVHIPSSAVRSAVLQRDSGITKAAPASVRHPAGLLLGDNVHASLSAEVRLSPDQRVLHTHIIGASGTGKSTLLFNLIRQDIENGDGVAVLDPHGDLIDRVLGIIPESRIDDVVLVDPSDADFPVGFNILSAHSEQEKTLLASDLVSVFRRLSSSWGDQMDTVLQNTILVFLESPRGGTLADLRRFLIEPPFRAEFLKTVGDPELLYYWQKVFPQLTGNRSVGPVLTRLQGFMSQKPIRNMVSQPENRLDFANIMDTRKIFLARLPEGLFGAENSYMLGTLLVSKFQQIAMSRQAQALSARTDYWLYIDEFDHFITPTMAEILKGARKYRLGLTLAHQELHQLQSDPKVASAVATHPSTRIVFRVSDDDAKRLAESFSSFDAQSLKNLAKFHAIARVEQSDCDFNLTIRPPENLDAAQTERRRHEVITASREKYARPRAEIEALLRARLETAATEIEQAAARPVAPPVPKDAGTKTIPLPVEVPKAAVEEKPASENADTAHSEHTAIKKRIVAEAESLDYTATIEELLPSGGRVDVVLRRGERAIACEISVTNTVAYETAKNITKCLEAGFGHVASVCHNRKKLVKIQESILATMSADQAQKVGFYAPDDFIAKLFEWATADPAGADVERRKPRKRKIALDSQILTESERTLREKNMLDMLRQAMKRQG